MEIRISRPARTCHRTEREFIHGEKVVSSVRLDNEHFVRQDVAEEAWEPEAGQGAIAVWTTAYVDPRIAEQQPPEVYSPLRRIFYEAVESDERVALATAYLAAELLRRQKVFKLLKQSDDPEEETKLALYNDRIGNRLVEVRDPNLSMRELEAGRIALVTRLQQLEDGEADPEIGKEESNVAADAEIEAAVDGPMSEEALAAVAAEETDATA